MTNAVVDLLGALAYGELSSFERITADSGLAPTLADKVQLARIAATEFKHFESIEARLREMGADPIEAMRPFIESLDEFHANLAPRDWLEGLLKVYVGDGIAADFYREMSAHLDEQTAQLVETVLSDVGHTEFAVTRIREAIAAEPTVAGRLALWGRRLMGEMISQATVVAATRPELHELFLETARASNDLSSLVNRLTVGHARRMDVLGLAS